MKNVSWTGLFVIATCVVLSGCATTSQAPSPSEQASNIQIPSLKVVIDCGSCQVRTNIPSLILDGYKEAAAKSGVFIAPTVDALVTIKKYSDRDDTVRLLVGIFAGKDEIQAVVTYQSKQFLVEDYYRNAWLGIESLATKIGWMIFEEIKKQ